jgi:hypothetical protein
MRLILCLSFPYQLHYRELRYLNPLPLLVLASKSITNHGAINTSWVRRCVGIVIPVVRLTADSLIFVNKTEQQSLQLESCPTVCKYHCYRKYLATETVIPSLIAINTCTSELGIWLIIADTLIMLVFLFHWNSKPVRQQRETGRSGPCKSISFWSFEFLCVLVVVPLL